MIKEQMLIIASEKDQRIDQSKDDDKVSPKPKELLMIIILITMYV